MAPDESGGKFLPLPIRVEGKLQPEELVVTHYNKYANAYVSESAVNGWQAAGRTAYDALKQFIAAITGPGGKRYRAPGEHNRSQGRPSTYRTIRIHLMLSGNCSRYIDQLAEMWHVDQSTVVSYLVLHAHKAVSRWRLMTEAEREREGQRLSDLDDDQLQLRLMMARR